ncbi:unnamed protein product [Rhodiola kirilowii]
MGEVYSQLHHRYHSTVRSTGNSHVSIQRIERMMPNEI